jgi:hypothetical protein
MTTTKSSLATMLSSALQEAAWNRPGTQFSHATNAKVFVDMLSDYIAEQIAQATTPATPSWQINIEKATPYTGASGITVEGIPPCMIDVEPAPDAAPVEDEHRALLDVIRELVEAQYRLTADIAIAIEYMPEFRQIVVNDMSRASAVNTRANAILAEQGALDIAPERDDED